MVASGRVVQGVLLFALGRLLHHVRRVMRGNQDRAREFVAFDSFKGGGQILGLGFAQIGILWGALIGYDAWILQAVAAQAKNSHIRRLQR